MSALDTPQNTSKAEPIDDALSDYERIKKMVKEGHRNRSKWRTEAEKAFNYVAGHQWSEEDLTKLNAENRPAVTFNRTAPIIDAVCGLEVNNRQGVIFLPRTLDNTGPDEVRTAAAKWVRDECGAEDEESESFRDASICGEGWIETRQEFDDNPEGQTVEERVDPLEMGVNKGATRANYVDARAIWRVKDIDSYDAKDMFPELTPDAIHCRWLDVNDMTPADGGQGNKKDFPDQTRDAVRDNAGRLLTCRMVQVQWWEREAKHMVTTGQDLQEMTGEEFAKFSERAKLTNTHFEHVKLTDKCYYEAFLGSDGFLPDPQTGEKKRKLPFKSFQWKAITAKRDRKLKCFYGMVRDMMDPQMWANKWLSQTMQILNANAKGGIMAESDAFVNQGKAELDWSDPTKIVWTKPGTLTNKKIQPRPVGQQPQGLSDLMNFALTSLRDTSGVNLELIGQADREQAASLESQRRQSAMTILASLFDSLRRFRKHQGRLLLHFVDLIPEGSLIRIVEKGQQKYIPFVKQQGAQGIDVIIDEAPTSPNQKQAVWAMVTQLLQSGIQLSPQTIVVLLKYSPLPESVVQEIAQSMGLGEEKSPQQLQEQLKQAEAALHVMEQNLTEMMEKVKTAEDQRAVEMMKLEIEEYKAKTGRLAAQWTAKVALAQALQDAANTPDPEDEEGGEAGPTAPPQAPMPNPQNINLPMDAQPTPTQMPTPNVGPGDQLPQAGPAPEENM